MAQRVVDAIVPKAPSSVNASTLTYLLGATIDYTRQRNPDIPAMEATLQQMGASVGTRLHELLAYRQRSYRRPASRLAALRWLAATVWPILFGQPADGLEEAIGNPNQFMLIENNPLIGRYLSPPADYNSYNPAAFNAGLIGAILGECGWPAAVQALYRTVGGQRHSVLVIDFAN